MFAFPIALFLRSYNTLAFPEFTLNCYIYSTLISYPKSLYIGDLVLSLRTRPVQYNNTPSVDVNVPHTPARLILVVLLYRC